MATRSSSGSQRVVARSRETAGAAPVRSQTADNAGYHLSPTWPELRIVRQATLDPESLNEEWNGFFNDFGRRHYGKGKAHSLGSVALVIVRAKDMGYMLEEKYPRAYTDPKKTAMLQAKTADGVRDFIREARSKAYHRAADDAEIAHMAVNAALGRFAFSNELAGLDEEIDELFEIADVDEDDPIQRVIPPSERRAEIQSSQTAFAEAVLSAQGIRLFGKDGYGLDLTANEQPYDERHAILRHLRVNEGLNTRRLESDGWEAHATIFTLEEHIRAASMDYDEIPKTIAFDQPHPL